MTRSRRTGLLILAFAPLVLCAQGDRKKNLPDISLTFKGTLVLPVPIGTPLFNDVTETVGQVDGVLQLPVYKGLSVGVGGKMSWFGIEERAVAPMITSGEIRRGTIYGKVAYERYTSERTFYELHGRVGTTSYTYDCSTCADDHDRSVLHWGLGAAWYIHASDNLAFGLLVGYERDAAYFGADDLGLESFPGRKESVEATPYQNLVFGMGFSTRFRRSEQGPGSW